MRQRSLALTVVAAALFVVAGCDRQQHPAAQSADPPQLTTTTPGPAPAAPLPPPELLTDVLYRLADTTVPAAEKVGLVEGTTGQNAAELDRFGKALRDSGYTPLGFTAEDIAWSDSTPGNVSAQITVHSENPALAGGFTFPMEFRPYRAGWQLSRRTADMLLTLGPDGSPPPTSTPPR